MRTVILVYHEEEGDWWCSSPDLRYVCLGNSYEQCQSRASEGVEWFLGEPCNVLHVHAEEAAKFVSVTA